MADGQDDQRDFFATAGKPGVDDMAGSPSSGGEPEPDKAADSGAPAPDGAASDKDAPESSAGDKAAGGKKRSRKFWREMLVIVVAAAALTLIVKAFVVQVYRIPSASMENTLLVGDRVLVNKLVYHFRGIARGDIIVFSGQDSWGPDAGPPPSNPVVRFFDDVLSDIGLRSDQTYYIKRVIGLPGDRVACCTNGKVTVNGVPLSESSFLFPGAAPSTIPFNVKVPAGHLWVMGDNRGDSDDSRSHSGYPGGGSIPENQVVGRAFLIIWPLSRFNDLPIPNTFEQAALQHSALGPAALSQTARHAGAAGGAALQAEGALGAGNVALGAVAAVPTAGAFGVTAVGIPLLAAGRLRRTRGRRRAGRQRRQPRQ